MSGSGWKGTTERRLSMIQFEEELVKFKPSREIDEVENILRTQTVADMTDILAEIMEEKRKNQ
jgi:hypothetical protein